MSLIHRPAQASDLETAEALVVSSINNLTERHGFGSMATASLPNFQLFSLRDDPDGLWVAEDDGNILGFAWSWVCGDCCYHGGCAQHDSWCRQGQWYYCYNITAVIALFGC